MAPDSGQLIVRIEGNVIQTVQLGAAVMTIGRAPDNGLVLPHPMVSRRHAELRQSPSGVILTDLDSSSGTLVGSELLLPNQPRVLADGDEVRVGPFLLVYQAPAQQHATVEALPDQAPLAPADEEPAPATDEPPAATEPTESAPAADEPPVARKEQLDAPGLGAPGPAAELVEAKPLGSNGYGSAALLGPDMAHLAPLPPARARQALPLLNGNVSAYLYDLPIIFHDNEFLGRYLKIFETIWEALEQRQDHIEMYFDPQTCPESFLPWLASWLDIAMNRHWPESRRRRLLTEATELYRWRGTRYGLTRMIEVCTGLTPQISDGPEPFVFHIQVTIPPESDLDPALIEDLIRAHKPAHAGYILETKP